MCGVDAMPFPIAPLLAALLGVAFALVGREEVQRSRQPASRTRAFLLVSLSAGLLFAPALGYFAAFYADWSWAYLLHGAKVPSAVSLLLVLATAALAPISFGWTASALRRHAVRELVRVVSGLVLALAALLAMLGPRLLMAGSTGAFREGYELSPASATSLGASILWIDGCLLGGILWAASQARRVGRAS
jgi:hypothetical protein